MKKITECCTWIWDQLFNSKTVSEGQRARYITCEKCCANVINNKKWGKAVNKWKNFSLWLDNSQIKPIPISLKLVQEKASGFYTNLKKKKNHSKCPFVVPKDGASHSRPEWISTRSIDMVRDNRSWTATMLLGTWGVPQWWKAGSSAKRLSTWIKFI